MTESAIRQNAGVRQRGVIKVWHDEKGYGFIDAGQGREVFAHVSDFQGLRGRPVAGQSVTFNLGLDNERRRRAVRVEIVSGLTPAQESAEHDFRQPVSMRFGFFAAAIAAAAMAAASGLLSQFVLGWLGAASLVSFLLYASDKSAANKGSWRVAERVLHAADVMGGWPGGLFAQACFRHKVRKPSFVFKFWMTVIVNICFLLLIISGAASRIGP